MLFQEISSILLPHDDTQRCVRNTAKALDWVTALALLVIGALGAAGILTFSPAAAYAFLGAGAVYTLFMIFNTVNSRRCADPDHNRVWWRL